jgi:hypothetical protein
MTVTDKNFLHGLFLFSSFIIESLLTIPGSGKNVKTMEKQKENSIVTKLKQQPFLQDKMLPLQTGKTRQGKINADRQCKKIITPGKYINRIDFYRCNRVYAHRGGQFSRRQMSIFIKIDIFKSSLIQYSPKKVSTFIKVE